MASLEFNTRIGTQTIGSQQDVGAVNKREGQIGGHDVTIGDRAKTPSRLSEAGSAIKSFFSKIGNAILSLPGRIATAYQEFKAERAEQARVREFNATRAELQGQLPQGILVDNRGCLTGTVVTDRFPTDPMLGTNSGKTFADVMISGAQTELSPKPGTNGPVQPPVIGGITIAHQADKDFYRMDMTFGSGAGNFDIRRDVQVKGEGARNLAVVQGLHAFAGSDNATTILSSVLTQTLSRPMLECFAKADGSRHAMAIEQGKIGGPFHMLDDNGVQVPVEPSGIGGLKVSVDRDQNGNFTVTGSWDMFLKGEGRASDVTRFKGMGDGLVKGEATISFTIDANEANQGRLAFVTAPTVQVGFSGRMEL